MSPEVNPEMTDQATATTVEGLAAHYARHFKAGERKSEDTGEMIRVLDDGAPEDLTELVHAAHGDLFPDDLRYEMIEDALRAIADGEDDTDFADGVNVYTAARLRWLASHSSRVAYCDEAAEDGLVGAEASMDERIGAGWYRERGEVYALVLAELEERIEARD